MGKLFVSNIPFKSTDEDLKNLFSKIAPVTSAFIIKDKQTGRSRGFGFVEMENSDKAIEALNNTIYEGRAIKVSVAREREYRAPHRKEWRRDPNI